jgi:hypothetical protein
MPDLNDLNKPVTTDTEPTVLDTIRGHISRAATWSNWTSTTNKMAGLMSAATTAVGGGRSLRLYRRNDANTAEEEVVTLPGMSIGGNSATATGLQADLSGTPHQVKTVWDSANSLWNLRGYLGSTDQAGVRVARADSIDWSGILNKPTTRAGYGITDVPLTNGTGASGTWAINISGTAANINGANSNTFTSTQTFNGSTTQVGMVITDIAETVTLTNTAASGTINYDVTTQSVQFHTVAATSNWTVNFRASSGGSLNSILNIGQSITVVLMAIQGSTPYFNNLVWVDGSAGNVTTRWQAGAAPVSGNSNGVDAYSYTIIKTGNGIFSIFASQTRFA